MTQRRKDFMVFFLMFAAVYVASFLSAISAAAIYNQFFSPDEIVVGCSQPEKGKR